VVDLTHQTLLDDEGTGLLEQKPTGKKAKNFEAESTKRRV
jgi:hypothetical protein